MFISANVNLNRRSLCLVKGLKFINVISVTNNALVKRDAIAGNIYFTALLVFRRLDPTTPNILACVAMATGYVVWMSFSRESKNDSPSMNVHWHDCDSTM